MKFGLKPRELEILTEKVFKPLKDKKIKVYVFGSRARGDHKKFSDVDILYKKNELKLEPGFISSIREAIEESNFPFKVDLVEISEVAESYKNNIMKDLIEI